MLRHPPAHPLPAGTGAWLVPSIPSATRGRWQATLDGVVSLCWHLYAWGHWRGNVLSMQMGKKGTWGWGCKLHDWSPASPLSFPFLLLVEPD